MEDTARLFIVLIGFCFLINWVLMRHTMIMTHSGLFSQAAFRQVDQNQL